MKMGAGVRSKEIDLIGVESRNEAFDHCVQSILEIGLVQHAGILAQIDLRVKRKFRMTVENPAPAQT